MVIELENGIELSLVNESMLDQNVNVIVNANNTNMRGGGGINGAIHKAAGPHLLEYLRLVAPLGAPTSQVIVTPAFEQWRNDYIFHVAGPNCQTGMKPEYKTELLLCYRNCIKMIEHLNTTMGRQIKSIAFCSISTGIYKYPLDEAAEVAVTTVKKYLEATTDTTIQSAVFAMYTQEEYEAYKKVFEEFSK